MHASTAEKQAAYRRRLNQQLVASAEDRGSWFREIKSKLDKMNETDALGIVIGLIKDLTSYKKELHDNILKNGYLIQREVKLYDNDAAAAGNPGETVQDLRAAHAVRGRDGISESPRDAEGVSELPRKGSGRERRDGREHGGNAVQGR